MSDRDLLLHLVLGLKNTDKMKIQEADWKNQWVCYLDTPNLDIMNDKGSKIDDYFF